MLDFLWKPYPVREVSQKDIWQPIGVGIFVALFLLFFRPFGLYECTEPIQIIMILGYGVITFAVSLVFLYLIPKYFIKIQDDQNWTVLKELTYLSIMLIIIGIFNTLYEPFANPTIRFSLYSFPPMIFHTIIIGLIPCTFFVLYDQNRLFKRHAAESAAIQLDKEQSVSPVQNTITVKTETETIEIIPHQILYIKSFGNYVKVMSHVNEEFKNELVKITMKNLETQIQISNIIRCHRSYFINLDKVIDIKGNAQGFKLSLQDYTEVIPVSRKYVPIIKEYYSSEKAL